MAKLHTIFKEHVNVTEKAWTANFFESCFQIEIQAEKSDDESGSRLLFSVFPEGNDGYELLIDYRICVDDVEEFIEGDKWDIFKELLCLNHDKLVFDVLFSVNIREILVAQDLTASTSYRNFHVLSADFEFYVNAAQLNQLGGTLFKEWYDRECQAETSVVVQSMDSNELKTLLQACCAYSSPMIYRQNFRIVLEISRKWRIAGLLRHTETFIMDSTTIHKIRKLEFAIEYRMARLADAVMRSFSSRVERLDCLFEYLSQNEETMDDVHPDILEMLEIYPSYLVL